MVACYRAQTSDITAQHSHGNPGQPAQVNWLHASMHLVNAAWSQFNQVIRNAAAGVAGVTVVDVENAFANHDRRSAPAPEHRTGRAARPARSGGGRKSSDRMRAGG